jgi:hypothetical protein
LIKCSKAANNVCYHLQLPMKTLFLDELVTKSS